MSAQPARRVSCKNKLYSNKKPADSFPQKSAGWLLTRVQRGLLHAAFDHAGEAFDTNADGLGVASGEIQPHGVARPALGVERRAGHVSHLLLDSDGEQLQRVTAFRQGQPEE